MGNTLCNGVYDATGYEMGAVLWPVVVCVCVSVFQLNSPMNSVSSTEDIKPPLGINGVMKVPAQPSGTSLSLSKHICTICGDRSSGEPQTNNCYLYFILFFLSCFFSWNCARNFSYLTRQFSQQIHTNSGFSLLKISITECHYYNNLDPVITKKKKEGGG